MNIHLKVLSHFSKHPLWEDVKKTCDVLIENGYEAYIAGGAVRDACLGIPLKDFDVATSATPEQIKSLFEHAQLVGQDFGVIVLPLNGVQLEVATFREDGEYMDGRHPDKVIYSSPEKDAQRRDFTVNAMFFDVKTSQLIDYCGGLKDLEKRVIRTVGSPKRRFDEDKLRVVRALRFAGQLGFSIEKDTFNQLTQYKNQLSQLTPERIFSELKKVDGIEHKSICIELIFKAGLCADILMLNEKHIDKEKVLSLLDRWSHCVGQNFLFLVLYAKNKDFQNALKRLRPPVQIFKSIQRLERLAESLNVKKVSSWIEKIYELSGAELIYFCEHIETKEVQNIFWQIDCVSEAGMCPEKLMSGKFLQEMGEAAGPQMGLKIKKGFDIQLSNPSLNQKQVYKKINS